MLMSPIRDTSLERWTPNRSLVLAPLWIHIMVHAAIPTTENLKSTSVAVFVTEIATFAALVAVAVSKSDDRPISCQHTSLIITITTDRRTGEEELTRDSGYTLAVLVASTQQPSKLGALAPPHSYS